MRPAIIVDIDGTVAEKGTRGPFEWTMVGADTLREEIAIIVKALTNSGYSLVFVSGRDEVCREATEQWLTKHFGPDYILYMRPEKDYRPDNIVKLEIYENNIKDKYKVLAVFDDRNKVVKMWRELGLHCLQVAEGDF